MDESRELLPRSSTVWIANYLHGAEKSSPDILQNVPLAFEKRTIEFGITLGWVNDDRNFIIALTIPITFPDDVLQEFYNFHQALIPTKLRQALWGSSFQSRAVENARATVVSLCPDICPPPRHFSPRCVLLWALSFTTGAAKSKMIIPWDATKISCAVTSIDTRHALC